MMKKIQQMSIINNFLGKFDKIYASLLLNLREQVISISVS